MRNISSAVLSLAAMALSSLTTYLSFFDARYTLTAAVADVDGQTQRGSSSGNGRWSVNFRFYAAPTIILSNRGTRALVVSEVSAVASDSLGECRIADGAERRKVTVLNEAANRYEVLDPQIIESGSVIPLEFEVSLKDIDMEGSTDVAPDFDLSTIETMWCLEWVIFDPNGKRHEEVMPGFVSTVEFEIPEGEDRPVQTYKLDNPKGAVQLLSRGIF
ncbi:MAG: hypothetical protein CME88_07380 [Hirschia sp.]|nr:hypothetical protein [Hirschia sp.]MBF18182.1 hypothetical protein [Hirschia sp.]